MNTHEYPLHVAEQAREILADAHLNILTGLAGDVVFVMKHGARSELCITLKCPAPTLFRAGRFTFTASDVKEIRPAPNNNWLIVLH